MDFESNWKTLTEYEKQYIKRTNLALVLTLFSLLRLLIIFLFCWYGFEFVL